MAAAFLVVLSGGSADAHNGLAVVQTLSVDCGGSGDVHSPSELSISPDGLHVYIVDTFVDVFRRDPATGELSRVESEPVGARAVTVSPDGNHVYAALTGGFTDSGGVAVFERDAGTGALTLVQEERGARGLRGSAALTVSPDGTNVYVTGAAGDGIVVFRRDASTGMLTFVEEETDGVGGVDGLRGAGAVQVSPDGAHVYVAGLGDSAVAVFSRDSATGALSFVGAARDGVGGVDGLSFVSSIALSPDGDHLYAASLGDDAVAEFARDPASGLLSLLEVHVDGSGFVDGLDGAGDVTLSPDGGYVYVGGRNAAAVATFVRDAASGRLTFARVERDEVDGADGLTFPMSLAASPDGAHLYVVSGEGVAIFARDESTGLLAFLAVKRPVQHPNGFALTRDDAHVYVPCGENVARFRRDDTSGELTFVEVQDLRPGAEPLVSPDGAN